MSEPLTDERLAAIQTRVEAIPYQASHPEARNMQSVYVTEAEVQLLANGYTDMRDLLAEVARLRERESEATVYALGLAISSAGLPLPELTARYIDKLVTLLRTDSTAIKMKGDEA